MFDILWFFLRHPINCVRATTWMLKHYHKGNANAGWDIDNVNRRIRCQFCGNVFVE